jgi:acetolactate synthase regulatory subunit
MEDQPKLTLKRLVEAIEELGFTVTRIENSHYKPDAGEVRLEIDGPQRPIDQFVDLRIMRKV